MPSHNLTSFRDLLKLSHWASGIDRGPSVGPEESSGVKIRLQPTCERPQVSLGLALRCTRSTTWGANEPYKARGADGLVDAACPLCEGEQQ